MFGFADPIRGAAFAVTPLTEPAAGPTIGYATRVGLLDTEGLRRLVRRLCALRRESASGGEEQAARVVAGELEAAGLEATLEHETVHGTFWWPLGLLCAAAALAPRLGRRAGPLAAALAAAGIVDELWVGRRWFRRRLPGRRTTTNVWSEIGSPGARTLVVHAHHDAAHTGLVFRPAIVRAPGRLAPQVVDRGETAPPMSWAMVAAATMAGVGTLAGARRVREAGATVCAIVAALMADVGRSAVVPGGNDNASGVAALLSLGRALAQSPPSGLRVVLLSTGAEESPLEGMEAWMRRHRPAPGTTFLCLDGLASEDLVVIGGEGMLRLHEYPDEPSATLERLGRSLGLALRRFSFRFATDGQVALREGYPAAALSSIDWDGAPRNYHLPSDDAEQIDYGTLFDATRLTLEFVRSMAPALGRDDR